MAGKVRRIPVETLSYSRKSPTELAPQRSHTTKNQSRTSCLQERSVQPAGRTYSAPGATAPRPAIRTGSEWPASRPIISKNYIAVSIT